ncbi:hypothetical protein [uncultured Polaribacter sp.]|uniref:hypothetical protein n=1 Tax=uncultured Polaribacter sp. TaxID=174711 RepID=UPI0026073657|nr:hypothetical protein [uncultured Polaribacter sp.]
MNHSNAQKLNTDEEKVVLNFIQLINNHNIDSLKNQVQYPLHRKKPFNSILDTVDFVNEYEVLFDEGFRNLITNSYNLGKWSVVGLKGIMLENGLLWLDFNGKLIAVNYNSKESIAKKKRLLALDKENIHESLRENQAFEAFIHTNRFFIRIDLFENNSYRLAYWPVNTVSTSKPKKIILKGIKTTNYLEGSVSYTFTAGNFSYVCRFLNDSLENELVQFNMYKNGMLFLKDNGFRAKKSYFSL